MLDGDEPGRRGRRRGLRLRRPRTDSFGVEGQHGEAVPLAASDRAPVAGDDDDRDGDGGGNRGSGRPRVRVSWTAGERGTGGGASEGAGGVEEGHLTPGRQVARRRQLGMAPVPWPPLCGKRNFAETPSQP